MARTPAPLLRSKSVGFFFLGAIALSACAAEDAPTVVPPPMPISAAHPPPPISGGTLLVTADSSMAVASDPDRDRVVLVDLTQKAVAAEIALKMDDEPGRVIEGAPGQVHVALRRAGEVITIDLAQRKLVRRTKVCAAPRGMAYDQGVVHVACASGELVTIDPDLELITRRINLQEDLRDVVVDQGELLVTQFRAARLLRIDSNGAIKEKKPVSDIEFLVGTPAAVAWRMVQHPNGQMAIVHQTASHAIIVTDQPDGYNAQGGPCGPGLVNSLVSLGGSQTDYTFYAGPAIMRGALPVDVAFSRDGSQISVVAAGSNAVLSISAFDYGSNFNKCGLVDAQPLEQGQPIAVAYAHSARIVQTREPARIVVGEGAAAEIIELGGESVFDKGHEVFHQSASEFSNLACASCHPEGGEDGRVWNFDGFGPRRTQTLAGGILATAPLHWDGTLESFDSLMNDVFTQRMGGRQLQPGERLAVAAWVDSIRHVPVAAAADPKAAKRGELLFQDSVVGCASCHSGARLTNNETVAVGTGVALQVPSLLGLAARAPYMHDGCAQTLEDRFNQPFCGGGDDHGKTSHLTAEEIADLVAYLKTL